MTIPDMAITWCGRQGVIEASSAGLAPGVWPEEIIVRDGLNEVTFQRERAIATRASFYGVQYRARFTNEVLHILND